MTFLKMIVHFKPWAYTLRAAPINEFSVYVSNICVFPNKCDVSKRQCFQCMFPIHMEPYWRSWRMFISFSRHFLSNFLESQTWNTQLLIMTHESWVMIHEFKRQYEFIKVKRHWIAVDQFWLAHNLWKFTKYKSRYFLTTKLSHFNLWISSIFAWV